MDTMDPLVVVGGGIAGSTCAKVLSLDNPQLPVVLISASSVVKVAANLRTIGRSIDIFDVIEQNSSSLQSGNLTVLTKKVTNLDSVKRQLTLSDGTQLKYSKLCICTGAKPKVIPVQDDTAKKYIKCIRDTQTAKDFQNLLAHSKRIVIIGNGGIATELVHKVHNCEIIWAIREDNFGITFFDSVVAKFFTDFLNPNAHQTEHEHISKRHHFTSDDYGNSNRDNEYGVALGPDWHSKFVLEGIAHKNVIVERNCFVENISTSCVNVTNTTKSMPDSTTEQGSWNVYVRLSNGKVYGCDMVISATGVRPNSFIFSANNPFDLCPEGGLKVDNQMRTSIEHIYAAGDVCTCNWQLAPHWFQMRLWTQARQMGFYSSKCISAHIDHSSPTLYFNFDVFTHVTNFFGFRVILLGLFNGQKLSLNECKILYRVLNKKELVKVILHNGTAQGAVLVGNTNLEETFENLIHNQIDLSRFGDNLLDDMLDVEDFFD